MNIWQFQMLISMKCFKGKEKGLKVRLEDSGVVVIEGKLDENVVSEIRNCLKQDNYSLIQQNNFQRLEIRDAESFSSVLDVLK